MNLILKDPQPVATLEEMLDLAKNKARTLYRA